jgi:hypothetical protein
MSIEICTSSGDNEHLSATNSGYQFYRRAFDFSLRTSGARSESGYDSNHKAGNFQRVDPGATPLSYLVTAPMEFAMDVWA